VFILDYPVVYLQQCEKYSSELLISFFEKCFAKETICTLNGSRVLIKPNLISAMGKGLACTHPQFLLALVEWLQLSGAMVVVGDSPAFGKAANVLKALRVDKELARRGVKIVEFHTAVTKKLQCGVEVGVAAEALECDFFVNAPKLKAHNQMYVTLAVKNLFGIVKGMRKSMLHMRYGGKDNMFSRIILDLIELLPDHMTAVDGIDVMHKEGPIRGTQLHFGCVALSRDPVAIDTSLLQALQLSPTRSPLWLEAQKRGCAGSDMSRIQFPLSPPEKFWGAGFEAPEELAPVRFNPFHFFYGNLKRLGLKIVKR